VAIEPLEEAVLVEDVGAGHCPECRRHSRLCAGCILLLISRSANALRQMAQSLSDESSSLVSTTSLGPRMALLEAAMQARLAWRCGG
jgi:hypothetical protein